MQSKQMHKMHARHLKTHRLTSLKLYLSFVLSLLVFLDTDTVTRRFRDSCDRSLDWLSICNNKILFIGIHWFSHYLVVVFPWNVLPSSDMSTYSCFFKYLQRYSLVLQYLIYVNIFYELSYLILCTVKRSDLNFGSIDPT